MMRWLKTVGAMFAVLVTVPGWAIAAAGPCPAAGEDTFNVSMGVFVLDTVIGKRVVITEGPVTISRGEPDTGFPDGHCEIQTEVVSMTLTGVFDPAGSALPVTITLDPTTPSLGQIISSHDGGGQPAFPNSSSLDLHFVADITGFGVISDVAMLVNELDDGNLWDPLGPLLDECEFYTNPSCPNPKSIPPCQDDFCPQMLWPVPTLDLRQTKDCLCGMPGELGGGVFDTHNIICHALHGDCPTQAEMRTWGEVKTSYR
jgi:hypothetical protein